MKVVILLGGNIGNTIALFKEAVSLLQKFDFTKVETSGYYQSPAWGYKSDNNYLNQVVTFHSDESPEKLLDTCLSIEKSLGRIRDEKTVYEDRSIDIDILYIGDQVINSERLTVPHPRLHLRKFTLCPLVEILPEFIHPILKKDHKSLLLLCPDSTKVEQI